MAFKRSEAKKRRKFRKSGRPNFTTDHLRRLGSAGVENMNPDAKHPNMAPRGTDKPIVYVLASHPSPADDYAGTTFESGASEHFLKNIPGWGEAETRFNYCVGTATPDDRVPTSIEIECFREEVRRDIINTRPNVILALGDIPFQWFTGIRDHIVGRGKQYPVRVGDHDCWLLPTMAPGHMLAIDGQRDRKVDSKQWDIYWKKDINKAYELADDDSQIPIIVDKETALSGTNYVDTLRGVKEVVDNLMKQKYIGFDIENSPLRPYNDDALLLSIAFSDGRESWTWGLEHSGAPWRTEAELDEVYEIMKPLFTTKDGPLLIAHNLPHEYEWLLQRYGRDIHSGHYGCSLNAEYVIDPGPPGEGSAGLSLNDCCVRRFGFQLKSLTEGAAHVEKLAQAPIGMVLEYNAPDAKWCLNLWKEAMADIALLNLEDVYEMQLKRPLSICEAQSTGVLIDQAVRKSLEKSLSIEIKKLIKEITSDEDVKEYSNTLSYDFSPTSPIQVAKFLFNQGILEVEVIDDTGKKSLKSDAKILKSIEDRHPIVPLILELRSVSKLLGTYVRRFDPKHEATYVYDDGRIHCSFNIARTRTARLSSAYPNNQQWPKRKHKEVRKQLVAPDGWVFLSSDYSSVEARVLAMESKDPVWVQSVWDGTDVHMDWAEKIAAIDPKYAQIFADDPKALRSTMKNAWVFAGFYGSSFKSIQNNLVFEDEARAQALFEEFWRVFAGVKQWQRDNYNFYLENGYVESLFGRRRNGPLSWNQTINSGVQGAANDICLYAMNEMFERSLEYDEPWLSPVLQIHDDLTFCVPKSEASNAIGEIVNGMLSFEADWVNVPLEVEVEMGPNLCDMDTVGQWSSQDIERD